MNIFTNIEFLNKQYFLLFIFTIYLVYYFYNKQSSWIDFIFLDDLKAIFKRHSYIFYLKVILFSLILLSYIIIIANPNIVNTSRIIKKNGIDIVIVLDISGSMEAEDLNPNRIEAAKKVIKSFIWNLETDRLWLVVFAWIPFTSIPLTFDYNILNETVSRLSVEGINQQKQWLWWTAIWDSILMAKTLFLKVDSESVNKKREKVIILLTDWDANTWVDPILAWKSAEQEWIRIYTIWIGSEKWWFVTYNIWPFKKQAKIPPLNDKVLKQIAKDTSWKYFRADNNKTFNNIFKELEKLEKKDIEIDIKKIYNPYYKKIIYILLLLLIFFIAIMLNNNEVKQNKN